jgi:hypothetical protein
MGILRTILDAFLYPEKEEGKYDFKKNLKYRYAEDPEYTAEQAAHDKKLFEDWFENTDRSYNPFQREREQAATSGFTSFKETVITNPDLTLLGLSYGASQEAIKRAYYSKMQVWHPDKTHNRKRVDVAEKMTKDLNAAYQRLKGVR